MTTSTTSTTPAPPTSSSNESIQMSLKVLTIARQNSSLEAKDEDDAAPMSPVGQMRRNNFLNRGRRASYVQTKSAIRVVCTEESIGNGKVEISFDWGLGSSSPRSSPVLGDRNRVRRGSILAPAPSQSVAAPLTLPAAAPAEAVTSRLEAEELQQTVLPRKESKLERLVKQESRLILDDAEAETVSTGVESQSSIPDDSSGGGGGGSSFKSEGQDDSDSIITFICSDDVMKIAVALESTEEGEAKYLVVVGPKDSNENVILGLTFRRKSLSLGVIIRIYAESEITLHDDGGVIFQSFVNHPGRATSAPLIFKPVSVFTMWSFIQIVNNLIAKARERNVYLGNAPFGWTKYYEERLTTDKVLLKEWNLMPDIFSQARSSIEDKVDDHSVEHNIRVGLRDIMTSGEVDLDEVSTRELRLLLEKRLHRDLRSFKSFVDDEMLNILGQLDSPSEILPDFLFLGSEWNASNLEELTNNGVSHIMNMAKEIDNFFPGILDYYNVREYDVENTNLLKYWHETSKYLEKVEVSGGRCLVHCKKGVSRSAATVIAFLMKSRRWSAQCAYEFVKERRDVVRPNNGFLRQLETFEGILNASSNRLSFKTRRSGVVEEEGERE